MHTNTNFTQNELYGALNIIKTCGNFSLFEKTVVVFDTQTKSVAIAFLRQPNQLEAMFFGGKHRLRKCMVKNPV